MTGHHQMQMTQQQMMHSQAQQMQQGAPPAQMPQAPAAQPGHSQSHSQQQQQAESDPVLKFKALLPRLRDSLVNLFKIGGHLFYQNAQTDVNGVQIDNVSGRFEKCLEEFYAICDQIEINLRLSHEVLQQDRDSSRATPISVLPPKSDASQPEGQLYSQYLSTVRAQITCAKDIRDALHDCLRSFPDHSNS